LCVHTGASALFYSTILNSRRQMALAAALAAKDQQTFDRQIKRAKRFAKENKALSATGVGVSAGLGIVGGGLLMTYDTDYEGAGNPKQFFWDKVILGRQHIGEEAFFAGIITYLMPWLYGVLPAALSLKQSIGDEKSAARIIEEAPFVHCLMQSPQFLRRIGLDNPQRMHRMVKKMERVAVSLQILLTAASAFFGFRQFGKTNMRSLYEDPGISSPLALTMLTTVITTPFFAFAFKPLLLAIWRKITKIPDMKRINKAIMHAIEHKEEWKKEEWEAASVEDSPDAGVAYEPLFAQETSASA